MDEIETERPDTAAPKARVRAARKPAAEARKPATNAAAPAAKGRATADAGGRAAAEAATSATKERRSAAKAATPAARERAKAGAGGCAAAGNKSNRWSAGRERTFLETLGETSNVAASARAAGLAESTVRRRRLKHEEFRAGWAAALREGVSKLETMLLERALNGVTKPVWHGGKQVGEMTEYSDRLALALLNAHRNVVMGAAPWRRATPTNCGRSC